MTTNNVIEFCEVDSGDILGCEHMYLFTAEDNVCGDYYNLLKYRGRPLVFQRIDGVIGKKYKKGIHISMQEHINFIKTIPYSDIPLDLDWKKCW